MPGWSNYDRYGYVHGNPINLIDPSGETSIWEALLGGFKVAGAVGKALAGGVGLAAKAGDWRNYNHKNAVNTIKRITNGKKYNDSHNSFSVTGRKIGEAFRWGTNMLTNIEYIDGNLYGIIDYTASFLTGRNPSIIYSNGTWGVRNSYMVDHGLLGAGGDGVSFTRRGVTHIKMGASQETIKHEFSHAKMFLDDTEVKNTFVNELQTDLRAGTVRYPQTEMIVTNYLGREQMVPFFAFQALRNVGTLEGMNYSDYYLRFSSEEFIERRNAWLDWQNYLVQVTLYKLWEDGWKNRY